MTSRLKRVLAFILLLAFLPATAVWANSVITDPALAAAIRLELGLASGKELKASDLQQLDSLFPPESKNKITQLQGLEYAVNLQNLFLPGQSVRNIKPLAKLKNLTFLALDGNQVADLSPLSGLTALEKLVIDGNQVKSLEPLSKLPNLTDLLAGSNQIADIGPLRDLKLEWAVLDGNRIQDLSPLENHPTLEYLYVENNLIQDIGVLESIPNLIEVSVAGNPLNAQASQVISRLKNKGVAVTANAAESPAQIQVVLDAESVPFDVPPFIQDGNTMVPFRVLFEKLGLSITWMADTQTILGEKEGTRIRMQVGQTAAEVNGKTITLAVPPTLVSGSTFVPLRFVAESLDAKVGWDGSSNQAMIRSKQTFASSDGSVKVTAYGSWNADEETSPSAKLALESYDGSTFAVRATLPSDLPPDTDLDTFYQDEKKKLLANPDSYVIDETEDPFQGHPAKWLTYYATEDDWKGFVRTSVFFEADGRFYQVTLSANEDHLDSALEGLTELLDTLELKPQQEA
ncbi:stalk domain-containing protein [Cohnella caldifontis]|uniref:stalk domain-containing protein n=1 Tax=Cohnella caldifontis TaxID=3027471 RepID=UPI0023EB69E3|nr:stalk domain-containing protein [Cohnella sp. YIM B05605]